MNIKKFASCLACGLGSLLLAGTGYAQAGDFGAGDFGLPPLEEERPAKKKAAKPVELSESAAKDLEAMADEYATLLKLRRTFKKDYAGSFFHFLGETENELSRREWGEPFATPGQGDWWAEYAAKIRNKIRHALFGGNLTEYEMSEFEEEDIGPGDHSEFVKSRIDFKLGTLADELYRRMNYRKALGVDEGTLHELIGPDIVEDIRVRTLIPDMIKKGSEPPQWKTVGELLKERERKGGQP